MWPAYYQMHEKTWVTNTCPPTRRADIYPIQSQVERPTPSGATYDNMPKMKEGKTRCLLLFFSL